MWVFLLRIELGVNEAQLKEEVSCRISELIATLENMKNNLDETVAKSTRYKKLLLERQINDASKCLAILIRVWLMV